MLEWCALQGGCLKHIIDFVRREEEKILLCKEKEIDAYKLNVLNAEQKHEKLCYVLNRINNDIASSRKSIARSEGKLDEVKVAYSQKSRALHTIEEALRITTAVS